MVCESEIKSLELGQGYAGPYRVKWCEKIKWKVGGGGGRSAMPYKVKWCEEVERNNLDRVKSLSTI